MKTFALLVLALLLTTCGGEDGGGNGPAGKTPEKVFDPWAGVGTANLPEDVVTSSVRALEFGDGMGISYDGSDEGGEEEVCRRERDSQGWYEVCMPLEDQPYFLALESNVFVWHPLLFDRFATELVCRIWMEGDGQKVPAECDLVLPRFGDEDFRCEAGVVNGDKALRCSDDWAVVVNGESDDTKTLCRVHIDRGSGRCLGAPVEGVSDRELILEMQRTAWEGYRSGQDNPRQFAPGEALVATVPRDLPVGAKLFWRSRDEEICTVDDAIMGGGVIMDISPPTTCSIVLKVEAKGYVDRVLIARLPVLKANDAVWGDYTLAGDGFYPGETLAAQAVTSTNPSDPDLEYASADESVCTVDGSTGEITAVGAGECTVTLTARAEDHLDAIIDRSVTVSALNQFTDIVWGFPGTATVGVDSSPIGAPRVLDGGGNNVTDSNLAVTVAHKSGDCAWDGTNRVISFSGTTECVMEVTAVGVRGHAEYSKEFTVTPGEGDMGLTWDGYTGGNVAVFGVNAPDLVAPVAVPGAQYSYAANGGGCEVNATTGVLTLVGAEQDCEVILTAAKSGYTDATVEVTVTINKGEQVLNVTNPYGAVASVGNGETLEIVNAPVGGQGNVNYKTDSADCTVDASTGALSAGASSGNCVVEAVWSGDANWNPSPDATIATIAMKASGNVAPVWSTTPYGSALAVGGSAVDQNAGAVTNTGAGNGNPEYKSATPDICSVNLADGAVTGLAVGTCTLQARFVGDNSKGASSWSNSPGVAVEKGAHPAPAADPYGASATLGVGDKLELETAPVGYGDAAYTTTTGTVCSVDESGTITAVGVGDCTVQLAFSGNENYHPLAARDLQTVTVTPGRQVVTLDEPYGTDPTLVVGGALVVVNPPTTSGGGTLAYRVKSSSASYCSVETADGTVTATGVGECTVEAQAAAVEPDYGAGEWVEVITLPVGVGRLSGITWTPGNSKGSVGENLTLAAVDGGDSAATVSYEVRDSGKTGCAFKAADQNDAAAERTLSFANPGRCLVVALGDKNGYVRWEQEHVIRVGLGTFELEDGIWGAFPSGPLVVSGPSMTPVVSGSAPVGVSISYILLRGERDCRLVNYRTGEVAALPVPLDRVGEEIVTKCSIVGVARKKGYRLAKSSPIEIVLGQGQIRLRSLPRYEGMRINPDGTVQLAKGGSLTLEADGHPRPQGRYQVEVGYSGRGYAAGTTDEKDVCSVDADTGEIVTLEAAAKNDICRLTIAVRDPVGSHEDLEKTLDFIIVEGALNFASVPVLNYGNGAKLKIGVSAPLTPTGLPPQDGDSIPVKWKYEVSGFAADSEDSKEDVCRVDGRLKIERQSNLVDNPDYGKIILGEGAGNGDTCRIQAYATAAGYEWYEGVAAVEFVVEGHRLLFAGGSGTKPAYPDELRLTGTATPDTSATADDNGVDVMWGSFAVVGDDVDGSDATDGEVCSVDPVTGMVTLGSAATVDDTCTVTAVASAATAENYDDSAPLELADFTIEATGTFASVAGPGYNPDGLRVGGDPLAFTTTPAVTPSDVNGGVVWIYAAEGKRDGVATDDICAVDENTGMIFPGSNALSGDTCEIIATAGANGYTDKAARAVVLTVKAVFQSLAWNTFPISGTVGVPIDLNSNQPVSVPPAGSYTVAIDSGDCDYTDGVLTFRDTTECVVEVIASKDNTISKKATFSLTPSAGTITLSGAGWGNYDTVTVGANPVVAPVIAPTPTGVTQTYTSLTGAVCSVNNTGTVAGLDDATCEIKLVLSHRGYTNLEHTYRFTVQTGTLPTISWGSFQGGGLRVGGSSRTPTVPTGVTGATFTYSLKQGSATNCTLEDTATGEVSAKAVDLSTTKTCTVIGTVSKSGYHDKTSGDISITLTKGNQPSFSWGQFSGTLVVGG